MLGVGISSKKYGSGSSGERHRETLMATRGTFDETTLPFGRDMGTSYIGDISEDDDFANFITSNVNLSRHSASGSLHVAATASNGTCKIPVWTDIGCDYTISVDDIGVQSGNAGIVQIGVALDLDAFHNSGNLSSAGTETDTFTATTNSTYITLFSKVSGKYARYSNISVKRA